MAKTATKKNHVQAAPASKKMIDGDRYEVLEYVDQETGKTMKSKGNGDAIHRAACWYNTSDSVLKGIAKDNEIDYDPSTYPNPGMAKMGLSQKLRAKLRKGEHVTVAGHVIKSLETKVPLPKAKAA